MTRKKKRAGVRRHGHHLHPHNECATCAHPREELVKRKTDPLPDISIPFLDELPEVNTFEPEEDK